MELGKKQYVIPLHEAVNMKYVMTLKSQKLPFRMAYDAGGACRPPFSNPAKHPYGGKVVHRCKSTGAFGDMIQGIGAYGLIGLAILLDRAGDLSLMNQEVGP